MTELKLTPQAIRKILNEAEMPKTGTKSVPVLSNTIQIGTSRATTGITVRNLIKGELIQVWAHTDNPKDDIHKCAELLKANGYNVTEEGFQCCVRL